MSDWTVHLGDCLDPVAGLASLPDKSVDHVITDPPYSEHVHANGRRGGTLTTGRGQIPDEQGPQRRSLDFDHLSAATQIQAAEHFARVARRWVVVFSDLENLFSWRVAFEAAGLDYVRCGVWVREGCTPQFSGDRPAAGVEAIVIGHQPGKKRWNGGGKRGVWSCEIVRSQGRDEQRVHTTQKPIPLMESLVSDFTDEGETILDPFAGSGTTGVACRRLGRRFVGWERDEKYHAIAVKRIGAAREQLRMFEGRTA